MLELRLPVFLVLFLFFIFFFLLLLLFCHGSFSILGLSYIVSNERLSLFLFHRRRSRIDLINIVFNCSKNFFHGRSCAMHGAQVLRQGFASSLYSSVLSPFDRHLYESSSISFSFSSKYNFVNKIILMFLCRCNK